MFNIKLKEYKERQLEIEAQLAQYTHADKDFYLNASMLLNLVKRAVSVFDGSEPATKRQILNFLLQNCILEGKNLKFELKNPFDGVLEANSRSNMLVWQDSFRTYRWEEALPNPLLVIQQVHQLLSLV